MNILGLFKKRPEDPGTLERDFERAIHSTSQRFILAVLDRIMKLEGDTKRYTRLMNYYYHLTHNGQMKPVQGDPMMDLFMFLFSKEEK